MTHAHRPTPALAPATHALLPGPSFGARSATRHPSGLARQATQSMPTEEQVLEKAIVEDTDSAWQKVRYLLRDVNRLGQPFWNGPNKKQAWLWTGQSQRPAAHARVSTLEATQGQILSQSPADATRFWWHLYGS